MRVTERVAPSEILVSPSGRTIVDFGQNLVGVVELDGGRTGRDRDHHPPRRGPPGRRALHRAAPRTRDAIDHYTLRGDGPETWHPRFTFHGFRYAEITGWPGELTTDDVTALVVHTDMTRTGWFECSDERINQLHQNVVWGMRGNFVGIPTDCPQRDERLGWTGDIGVFAPTATFLYDCAGLLESWLRDLAAEQRDDGTVPWVIPDALDWLLPGRGVGRRRRHRSHDAPRAVRRRRRVLAQPVRQHAGVGRPRARAGGRRPPVDRRVPVRRLARSHGRRRPTPSTSAPIPICSRPRP